jgi:hypothetical protein
MSMSKFKPNYSLFGKYYIGILVVNTYNIILILIIQFVLINS